MVYKLICVWLGEPEQACRNWDVPSVQGDNFVMHCRMASVCTINRVKMVIASARQREEAYKRLLIMSSFWWLPFAGLSTVMIDPRARHQCSTSGGKMSSQPF